MSDKVSVIRHAPLSRFLVIYEDYLVLCKEKGIEPADAGAGILRVFEQWTNGKVNRDEAEVERARQYASQGVVYEPEDLWIWLPQDTLKRHELFDIFGERSVASALKRIVEVGYLETRRNPKYGWDRTLQYRLNVTGLQKDLDELQKRGLALPQSAVINERKPPRSKSQNATSNTTVTSNESLQKQPPVATNVTTDSAPTDAEYDAWKRDLETKPVPPPQPRRKLTFADNPDIDRLKEQNGTVIVETPEPTDFDLLVLAVQRVLNIHGGGAEVYAKMLDGQKGRGEYNTYRMDEPVTATELQDWATWHDGAKIDDKTGKPLRRPTIPMKLQSSIIEWRNLGKPTSNTLNRPAPVVAEDVPDVDPRNAADLLTLLKGGR